MEKELRNSNYITKKRMIYLSLKLSEKNCLFGWNVFWVGSRWEGGTVPTPICPILPPLGEGY